MYNYKKNYYEENIGKYHYKLGVENNIFIGSKSTN